MARIISLTPAAPGIYASKFSSTTLRVRADHSVTISDYHYAPVAFFASVEYGDDVHRVMPVAMTPYTDDVMWAPPEQPWEDGDSVDDVWVIADDCPYDGVCDKGTDRAHRHQDVEAVAPGSRR